MASGTGPEQTAEIIGPGPTTTDSATVAHDEAKVRTAVDQLRGGYLTTVQVAEATGFDVSTIKRHIHRGLIQAKKRGGQWLIPETQVRMLTGEVNTAVPVVLRDFPACYLGVLRTFLEPRRDSTMDLLRAVVREQSDRRRDGPAPFSLTAAKARSILPHLNDFLLLLDSLPAVVGTDQLTTLDEARAEIQALIDALEDFTNGRPAVRVAESIDQLRDTQEAEIIGPGPTTTDSATAARDEAKVRTAVAQLRDTQEAEIIGPGPTTTDPAAAARDEAKVQTTVRRARRSAR